MIALYFLAGWLLASIIAALIFCALMGGREERADQDRVENHHHNGSVY